jgi:hypothetical protein
MRLLQTAQAPTLYADQGQATVHSGIHEHPFSSQLQLC